MTVVRTFGGGAVKFLGTDRAIFSLVKVRRDDWICSVCRKKIKKDMFCMGSQQNKTCVDCAPKMIDDVVKDLKDFCQTLAETKTLVLKHKQYFDNVNTLASLKNTDRKLE